MYSDSLVWISMLLRYQGRNVCLFQPGATEIKTNLKRWLKATELNPEVGETKKKTEKQLNRQTLPTLFRRLNRTWKRNSTQMWIRVYSDSYRNCKEIVKENTSRILRDIKNATCHTKCIRLQWITATSNGACRSDRAYTWNVGKKQVRYLDSNLSEGT